MTDWNTNLRLTKALRSNLVKGRLPKLDSLEFREKWFALLERQSWLARRAVALSVLNSYKEAASRIDLPTPAISFTAVETAKLKAWLEPKKGKETK